MTGGAGGLTRRCLTSTGNASAISTFTVTPPAEAGGASHLLDIAVTRTSNGEVTEALAGIIVAHNVKPGPATTPNPADGATGVELLPTLKWIGGAGTVSHAIYFGTTFPPPFAYGNTLPRYSPGLLKPSTKYFWRVVEKNEAGSNDSSPIWSFTTEADRIPSMPTNNGPYPDAYRIGSFPRLRWFPGVGGGRATSFDVYLGKVSDPPLLASNIPNPVHIDPTIGVIYDTGPLEYGAKYYWRVVAKNAVGTKSSRTWMFKTIESPDAPRQLEPIIGRTGVSRGTSFRWAASPAPTSVYKFYLGTAYPPPFVQKATGTSFTPPAKLAANTKYFWRVIAVGPNGEERLSYIWYFWTQ